jgi:hypothetical protein
MTRARAHGQNSRAIARGRSSTRRARAAKTRPRPRHAGGRPLLFIPAAVVARAAELAWTGLHFSTVVRSLEREGNGAWPRRTLMRRVRSTTSSSAPARGQNRRSSSSPAPAADLAAGVAKTSPVTDAIAARILGGPWPEYDTPAYHDRLATLHGLLGGKCGCYSCGRARSSPTVRR